MILTAVLCASAATGVVVGVVVRRWPVVGSPHLGPAGITRRLVAHPRLARLLRADKDPRRTSAMMLVTAAGAVVVGVVGLGILLLMIRSDSGLARFDLRLANFGARDASAASTRVLKTISLLGGTTGIITAATVVGIVEYWRQPSRALPAFLATVVLGQFAVANVVKWLVDRARPAIDQLTGFAGTSFPSGHATAAAAGFAAFALLIGRRRSNRTRATLGGVAAAIAAAVATTRVFLGVHWFTDVVGGLILGWTWFAICSIIFGGRWMHFGAPVEMAERIADEVPTSVPG